MKKNEDNNSHAYLEQRSRKTLLFKLKKEKKSTGLGEILKYSKQSAWMLLRENTLKNKYLIWEYLSNYINHAKSPSHSLWQTRQRIHIKL